MSGSRTLVGNAWVRRASLVLWASLAVLCAALPATGQTLASPEVVVRRYHHDVWRASDGFPGGTVVSIEQTPDGYLWMEATNQIVRFDGVRFTVVLRADSIKREDGTTENRQPLLRFVDDAGRLWITFEGGNVAAYADGRLTRIPASDSSLSMGPETPIPIPGSGMLVVFRDELWSWRDGVYSPARLASVEPRGVTALATDSAGRIYVAYRDGRIVRTDGRSVVDLKIEGQPPDVMQIEPTDEGTVWVRYPTSIARWKDGRGAVVSPADSMGTYYAMTADRDGGVWLASRLKGLWRLDATGMVTRRITDNELGSSLVWALCVDREGSLWVGTSQGLERFRETPFISLDVAGGIAESRQGLAWVDSHTFWTVARDGSVRRIALPDSWELVQKDAARPHARVTARTPSYRDISALAASGDGGVWIGTSGAVERWSPRGERIAEVPGLTGDAPILRVLETRAGVVWVATTRGMFRLDNGRFRRFVPSNAKGVRFPSFWGRATLFEDRQGNLWVGSAPLFRIDGDSATRFDGLAGPPVSAIHEDSAGTIWVAAGRGAINRIRDGRVTIVSLGAEMQAADVLGLAEDTLGNMWIASDLGVQRIPIASLNGVADRRATRLESTTFSMTDGLPSLSLSGRQSIIRRAADGKLWVAFDRALAVVDPGNIPHNAIPPPVRVEEITVDEAQIPLDDAVRGLAAGSYRVGFRFTGTSLLVPDRMRFRYRLEGAEEKWTEQPGLQRTASYTRLAPGPYTFHVQAANNDGVWNTSGAAFAFRVLPAWYQTWWAMVAGVALVVATAAGAARSVARTRQRRQEERFHAMLEERSRMAREMHDTLLQGFTGITLQLQSLKGKLHKDPAAVEPRLTQLLEIADATLVSARQAVWEMRPPELERADLADALNASLARITGGSPLLQYRVTGRQRRLAPGTETALLRIAMEAATNTVKHAGAGVLDVELTFGRDDVMLRLQDDGCGFQLEQALAAGGNHFGLAGIRERARLAGTELTIVSSPGNGTSVLLTAREGNAPQAGLH